MFVAAGSEGKLTVVAQKMSVLSGKRLCKHFSYAVIPKLEMQTDIFIPEIFLL